jgi:hypothetical protein
MLVIDQLPASLLGPYGNTTIETASFNRLAAESLLFDFAFAESLDLRASYRRLWTGIETDAERILVTDDSDVASLAQTTFDRVILIEQPVASESASSPAGTQIANFFAQVSAWIAEELDAGQLCWIHSRGLGGDWDAPYDLRLKFVGEDDPLPPQFIQSPRVEFESSPVDPDRLLGYQQAAAAQVVLLDDCLGVLTEQMDELAVQIPVLFVCTSPRGFGLGEHGLVGVDQQLFSEAVQVPLIIRFPCNTRFASERVGRSGSLTSIRVLAPLVQAWLNGQLEELGDLLERIDQIHPEKSAEIMAIGNDDFEMVQTHAWKLIRKGDGNVQLFAKPDDRWEINDVSDRCPLVVEKLVDLLDRKIGFNGNPGQPILLEDELVLRRD